MSLMRVQIRGVEYETVKHAANVLGVKPVTIYAALNNGSIDGVGYGLGGRASRPVTIRGVEYKSMAAAARKLGVTPATISTARSEGRLEAVGLGKKLGPYGKYISPENHPVKLGGLSWPTLAEAAKDLGYNYNVFWHAMRHGKARAKANMEVRAKALKAKREAEQ